MIRGEISELFGQDTVMIDTFMRKLGLRRMAESAWDLLDEDGRN